MEGGEWSVDSKTTLHFLLSTFEEITDGGEHEETEEDQSFEGSLETEKC
jgi:hypothetical protein